MSQRAGLSMSRIDTGRDSLQMGIMQFPTLLSAFDSRAYVQDYIDTYFAGDTPASPPTVQDQQQQGGGIVSKINKGLGSAIGLPNGLVTDSVDSFKQTLIVAAIGIVLLGVGAYVVTK